MRNSGTAFGRSRQRKSKLGKPRPSPSKARSNSDAWMSSDSSDAYASRLRPDLSCCASGCIRNAAFRDDDAQSVYGRRVESPPDRVELTRAASSQPMSCGGGAARQRGRGLVHSTTSRALTNYRRPEQMHRNDRTFAIRKELPAPSTGGRFCCARGKVIGTKRRVTCRPF
jgi:hypothetical protein